MRKLALSLAAAVTLALSALVSADHSPAAASPACVQVSETRMQCGNCPYEYNAQTGQYDPAFHRGGLCSNLLYWQEQEMIKKAARGYPSRVAPQVQSQMAPPPAYMGAVPAQQREVDPEYAAGVARGLIAGILDAARNAQAAQSAPPAPVPAAPQQ